MRAGEVFSAHCAKLALFEVAVDEIHSIERGLGAGSTGDASTSAPKSGLFLHAQVRSLNQLTDQYNELMDGAGGASVLKALGCDERLFTPANMPAAPSLAAADEYACAW